MTLYVLNVSRARYTRIPRKATGRVYGELVSCGHRFHFVARAPVRRRLERPLYLSDAYRNPPPVLPIARVLVVVVLAVLTYLALNWRP